jgi:alkyldihydroxyacetonephosphate synthase
LKSNIKQMKWWGWGDEGVEFSVEGRPDILPFVKKTAGVEEFQLSERVKLESIKLNEVNRNEAFIGQIQPQLTADQLSFTHLDRVQHAYGKSVRDLWRVRQGLIDAAPDCVIYPSSGEDVQVVVAAAQQHGVIIIPFGGGSNIAGCLEPKSTQGRMVVSLDMKGMQQLISLDKGSNVAVIQAGAMGPYLEEQLNKEDFTLGHFPDSFMFSSLGGWVATRSAGMMSDKYGKIEDMVIAIKMVTPKGEMKTISVPKASDGIDIKHLLIGSEGILGVITEVTVQVHHLPECQSYVGYLFPDFESGVAAMRECLRQDCMPVMTRLNDPGKTQLSFAFKKESKGIKKTLGKAIKWYLARVKKINFDQCCLMLNIFEGNKSDHARIRAKVKKIYCQHGAAYLGKDPGHSFSEAKFDFPYIRDYLLDRKLMGDVSETSTGWGNLLPLYYKTMDNMHAAMKKFHPNNFTGCHISHTYQTGASLYFTFCILENPDYGLQHYLTVKKSLEDSFMENGGTLSHHHAVGYEHLPWVEQDVGALGVGALKALKNEFDPNGIMNPGKLIPGGNVWQDWGLDVESSTPEDVVRS